MSFVMFKKPGTNIPMSVTTDPAAIYDTYTGGIYGLGDAEQLERRLTRMREILIDGGARWRAHSLRLIHLKLCQNYLDRLQNEDAKEVIKEML